jgi:hypothetical protein
MDVRVVESLNGGDLVKKNKDIDVLYGFENMVYLALFGGNVEASTPIKRLRNEHAYDWWGNSLLMPNNPSMQFNSNTERVLNKTALTSRGRIEIERAVYTDLEFLKPFGEVKVSVTIPTIDHVRIFVRVKEPNNLQQKEFIYIWDGTRGGIPDNTNSEETDTTLLRTGFDYLLDFNIE